MLPSVSKKKLENLAFCNFVTLIELVSVADPDPGSGAFLTPGSGIRNRFLPDPGSQIPDPGSLDHIFKSFLKKFLVKSSIIL
jgi:hypothetical protein